MKLQATYFPVINYVIFLIIVGGNELEKYVECKHSVEGLVHYKHGVIVDVREGEEERSQSAVVDQ
jgi:hypothetical protein